MNRELPAPVSSECGQDAVLRLSLARADLYIALASTCPSLSSPSILTKSSDSPLAQAPSRLFTLTPTPESSQPPSETNLLGASLPHTVPKTPPSWSLKEPQHLKIFLVKHAERVLVEANRSLSSLPSTSQILELRVRVLLSLSRLSLCLEHSSTAVKLSLAALRTLQSASTSVGHRLWLESRYSLAKSLVGWRRGGGGSGEGVMDCAVQCEEGVREALQYGDTELAAEFHFLAALHSLSLNPPNTTGIMEHTQVSISYWTWSHY